MNDQAPKPAEPITIKLGGQTYLLCRMRVGIAKAFERWMRQELDKLPSKCQNRFAAVKAQVQDLPDELRAEFLRQAMQDDRLALDEDRAMRRLDSPEALELSATIEATTFLLWQHLRPNHPELTLERVADLLDGEDIASIQEQLSRLRPEVPEQKEPEGNAPAQPASATPTPAGTS